MKPRFVILPALMLSACATVPKQPEPIIKTVEVQVPHPVPCPALQKLGPEPAYPDTDAALKAAPNIFVRVQLLMAGRVLRITRLAAVNDALAECDKKSAPTG